jgi:hypothetical protein
MSFNFFSTKTHDPIPVVASTKTLIPSKPITKTEKIMIKPIVEFGVEGAFQDDVYFKFPTSVKVSDLRVHLQFEKSSTEEDFVKLCNYNWFKWGSQLNDVKDIFPNTSDEMVDEILLGFRPKLELKKYASHGIWLWLSW